MVDTTIARLVLFSVSIEKSKTSGKANKLKAGRGRSKIKAQCLSQTKESLDIVIQSKSHTKDAPPRERESEQQFNGDHHGRCSPNIRWSAEVSYARSSGVMPTGGGSLDGLVGLAAVSSCSRIAPFRPLTERKGFSEPDRARPPLLGERAKAVRKRERECVSSARLILLRSQILTIQFDSSHAHRAAPLSIACVRRRMI